MIPALFTKVTNELQKNLPAGVSVDLSSSEDPEAGGFVPVFEVVIPRGTDERAIEELVTKILEAHYKECAKQNLPLPSYDIRRAA